MSAQVFQAIPTGKQVHAAAAGSPTCSLIHLPVHNIGQSM